MCHKTSSPRGPGSRKARRAGARGFTLLEVMTVVAILGVLVALSYSSFRTLPHSAKVSSSVSELVGELSAAKSMAYGRDIRMAVLLYAPVTPTGTGPIQYWSVVDPWFTIGSALKVNPSWKTPSDLPQPTVPVGTETTYRTVSHGQLDPVVTFVTGGFATVVSNVANPNCKNGVYALASGNGGGHNFFPPPYCIVPDDADCTFCTRDATAVRGAIIFEPDGRIRLMGGDGVEVPAGAGSITLNATDLSLTRATAVTLTSAGLLHTFRGPK